MVAEIRRTKFRSAVHKQSLGSEYGAAGLDVRALARLIGVMHSYSLGLAVVAAAGT